MAAKRLGMEMIPVDEQEYISEAQEWADLVADNRIAELAEMDRAGLKDIIENIDTGEIDLELTGYDESDLAMLMTEIHQETDSSAFNLTTCPECGNEF